MNQKHILIISLATILILINASVSSTINISEDNLSTSNISNPIESNQKEFLYEKIIDIFKYIEDKELFDKSTNSNNYNNHEFQSLATYLIFKNPAILLPLFFIKDTHLSFFLRFFKNFTSSKIDYSEIYNFVASYNFFEKPNSPLNNKIYLNIKNNNNITNKINELNVYFCDCEDQSEASEWPFPIICSILLIPAVITMVLWWIFKLDILSIIFSVVYTIGELIGCSWA